MRALLAMLIASGAAADVWYVDAGAAPGGDGQSWDAPFIDLQDALGVAKPTDQIWIAKGRYRPSDLGLVDVSFVVPPDVALYGGFIGGESDLDERDPAANPTILTGDQFGDDDGSPERKVDNSRHVVVCNMGSDLTRLDGLTIRDGWALGTDALPRADRRGGGILIRAADPVIADCVLTGNEAGNGEGGGAVHIASGSPRFERCVFRANDATGALPSTGGAALLSGGVTTFDACAFERNASNGEGGAIFVGPGAVASVLGCDLDDNDASGRGGAIAARHRTADEGVGTTLFVANSIFRRNEALDGGAIASSSGVDLLLLDADMRSNLASDRGGSIFLDDNGARLERCSILGSHANAGGALAILASGDEAIEVLIDRGRLTGATATLRGGVIHAFDPSNVAHVKLTSVTVIGAESRLGAAFSIEGAKLTFLNGRLSGGSAQDGGVATLSNGATFDLRSSTVHANVASGLGAVAILDPEGASDPSRLDVANTIIWENLDESGATYDAIVHLGAPGSVFAPTFCCLQGWTPDLGGAGNIGDDPDFVDPIGEDGLPGTLDDDLHLRAFSPCIDAGASFLVPSEIRFDLDLDPRFIDDPEVIDTGVGPPPIVDIGADERVPDTACAVDLNGDDLLDVFDILEFLEAFEKQSPAADWNGDSLLDIFDVTAFLGDFSVGCS